MARDTGGSSSSSRAESSECERHPLDSALRARAQQAGGQQEASVLPAGGTQKRRRSGASGVAPHELRSGPRDLDEALAEASDGDGGSSELSGSAGEPPAPVGVVVVASLGRNAEVARLLRAPRCGSACLCRPSRCTRAHLAP